MPYKQLVLGRYYTATETRFGKNREFLKSLAIILS